MDLDRLLHSNRTRPSTRYRGFLANVSRESSQFQFPDELRSVRFFFASNRYFCGLFSAAYIGHARVREKTIQGHRQALGAGRLKSTFSRWSMAAAKWSRNLHSLRPSRTITSIRMTRRTSGASIRRILRHRIVISTSLFYCPF